jgi:hypothetical protein
MNNDALIRALENARSVVKILLAEVARSQDECPHPEEDRRVARNTYSWCRRCHKKLAL